MLYSPDSRAAPHSASVGSSTNAAWISEGAEQAIEYCWRGKAVLEPCRRKPIVAERFFDESGGMQSCSMRRSAGESKGLGARPPEALLRHVRFRIAGRGDGQRVVISLGEKHSFPLESVFGYLHSDPFVRF